MYVSILNTTLSLHNRNHFQSTFNFFFVYYSFSDEADQFFLLVVKTSKHTHTCHLLHPNSALNVSFYRKYHKHPTVSTTTGTTVVVDTVDYYHSACDTVVNEQMFETLGYLLHH